MTDVGSDLPGYTSPPPPDKRDEPSQLPPKGRRARRVKQAASGAMEQVRETQASKRKLSVTSTAKSAPSEARAKKLKREVDFTSVWKEYRLGKIAPDAILGAVRDKNGSYDTFKVWLSVSALELGASDEVYTTLVGLTKALEKIDPQEGRSFGEFAKGLRDLLFSLTTMPAEIFEKIALQLDEKSQRALRASSKQMHSLFPLVPVSDDLQAKIFLYTVMEQYESYHERGFLSKVGEYLRGISPEKMNAYFVRLFQSVVHSIPESWQIEIAVNPKVPDVFLQILADRFKKNLTFLLLDDAPELNYRLRHNYPQVPVRFPEPAPPSVYSLYSSDSDSDSSVRHVDSDSSSTEFDWLSSDDSSD